MDMEENEFHQRQPLLAADPDDILLENGLSSLGDSSPRIRSADIKRVNILIICIFLKKWVRRQD